MQLQVFFSIFNMVSQRGLTLIQTIKWFLGVALKNYDRVEQTLMHWKTSKVLKELIRVELKEI